MNPHFYSFKVEDYEYYININKINAIVISKEYITIEMNGTIDSFSWNKGAYTVDAFKNIKSEVLKIIQLGQK
jgi:hypothetical protein